MKTQHNRFKDAVWINEMQKSSVIIGGSGGIGSWLSLVLSRTGVDIHLFDDDTIEEHNIGGQFFPMSHVGISKVQSVQNSIQQYSNERINIYNEKFTTQSIGGEYMFSGFDNMQARKDMFEVWLKNKTDKSIFIDGRLLFESISIFCIRGNDEKGIEDYKTKYLFDDADVPKESCTLKQTSHTASFIADVMMMFFTNHLRNLVEETEMYNVPFVWEYYVPFGEVKLNS